VTTAVPAAPQPPPAPGIEVTHDPEVAVRFVQLWLCDPCLDGMGGECHTPGCALWLNRAPDIQLRDSPAVTIMDAAPEAAPEVWSDAVPPGGMVCAVPDDLTADGICGNPVESEPCNRHDGEPAAPARSLTAPDVVAGLLADVAESRAQLAECEEAYALAHVANEKLTAERDDARTAFASLAGHFTQAKQPGWTARVSGTVLRRLCVMAMCEPPSGSDGLHDEAGEWAVKAAQACQERDDAREQAEQAELERNEARRQLATTQAIARMLQATAIEILGELWPGPRYDGMSEDFRKMQAKVDEWRKRAGLDGDGG